VPLPSALRTFSVTPSRFAYQVVVVVATPARVVAVAQAEQAAQARARVLAAASHDLRQPLHVLSIYTAILNAGPDRQSLPEV